LGYATKKLMNQEADDGITLSLAQQTATDLDGKTLF
jgi:hypothetical protein